MENGAGEDLNQSHQLGFARDKKLNCFLEPSFCCI